MNDIVHDNTWGRLWKRWLLPYAFIVLIVYLPGIICNIYTGTFKSPTNTKTPCETPFLEDYLFHINWLLIFPAFILLIPTYLKNADDCLRKHLGIESIPYNKKKGLFKGMTPLFRSYLLRLSFFFLVIAVIVSALNIRSLRKAKILKTWNTPSLETIPTSVFFFASAIVLVLASAVFLAYHYSVMAKLKEMTSSDKTAELAWSVAPGGPIHATFSSFLHLLYPVAFVPIGIIISRTMNLKLSLLDPVTLFNMIAIPLGILIWVLFPFTLTAIPKYLRMKRIELLQNNAMNMSKIWNKLSKGAKDANKETLLKEMDYLEKERAFIEKHYPMLLLSKHARIVPVVISSTPVVLSLVRVLIDFLK